MPEVATIQALVREGSVNKILDGEGHFVRWEVTLDQIDNPEVVSIESPIRFTSTDVDERIFNIAHGIEGRTATVTISVPVDE